MDDLYLDAKDASERLQISVTSIYAYVSRGLIRSRAIPGSKKRLYWRADIEQLAKSEKSVGDPAELPTRLVEQTRITLLTPSGHYYRGESAIALSATASLEDIAALLWQIDKASAFHDQPLRIPSATLAARRPDETIAQRTIKMLFAIENANPRAFNLSREGFCRSGADALRCAAAAALDLTEIGTSSIHDLVCDTLGAAERFRDVIRAYLVLAADHELDPATYAVRAAANTGVTPYAAIAAGLIAFSGRRRVFGQAGSVDRFLEELEASPDPTLPVLRRLRAGETIPGFGTSPYANGDPRALRLMELLGSACSGDRDFAQVETVIATVLDATGAMPSFALPALYLERKLGMKVEQTTLLGLARVVGWIAHAMEQYYESHLVRPHADYAGILPEPRVDG